ncbi:MAG: hypothetical protein DI535_14375 [Citrobacter freundii]|nr:MAG: hypothetical protein DI535_14375 [Citrobacter freundii]
MRLQSNNHPLPVITTQQYHAGISINRIAQLDLRADPNAGFSLFFLAGGGGIINFNHQPVQWNDTYVSALTDTDRCVLKQGCFKTGYHIELSRTFIQRNNLSVELLPFSKNNTGQNGFSLQPPAAEEINDLFKKISLLQDFTNGQDESITATLIKLLLLYLQKAMPETNRSVTAKRQHALADLFFSSVSKHFRAKKMVTDYANELCISPHYLTQVVKEVTGETPSYFIQQQIAKEAKKQAMISSKSMKEVAYELGFDDQAHFSKFFKKNTGMNFTAFRSRTIFTL